MGKVITSFLVSAVAMGFKLMNFAQLISACALAKKREAR